MSVEIYPYYLLAQDPTNSADIAWIDNRSGADGSVKVLHYGTNPNSLSSSVNVNGNALPQVSTVGAYVYISRLSSLSANTLYYGEIEYESGQRTDTFQFKTFPTVLGAGKLKVGIISDIHIDYEMTDPEEMRAVKNQDPELVMIGGDIRTSNGGIGENVISDVVGFFRDYISILNEGQLMPLCAIPGNHEVGNSSWDGTIETGEANPFRGFFWQYFLNVTRLGPLGQHYFAITIGDYFQIIGLDTHSAFTQSQRGWLQQNINFDVKCVVPVHHSPMWPGAVRRDPEDFDLQNRVKDNFSLAFFLSNNIHCHFSGHIHVRQRSVPWQIVDELPSGVTDFYELPNGTFIIEDTENNGVVEFGSGYSGNRISTVLNDQWFLAFNPTSERKFYILEVDYDELKVDVIRDDEETIFSQTFQLVEPVKPNFPKSNRRSRLIKLASFAGVIS